MDFSTIMIALQESSRIAAAHMVAPGGAERNLGLRVQGVHRPRKHFEKRINDYFGRKERMTEEG